MSPAVLPRRILLVLALLALVLSPVPLRAQTTRDFAIDLKVTPSDTPPHITLDWTLRQAASISAQAIYRRPKGSVTWNLEATLGNADTTYADPTAVPGVEYEYWMRRTYTGLSPNTAVGYITAAVNLPLVENRGTLLLVVDDTMVGPLGPEIEQLRNDLTGDGWTVQTIAAPRRDSVNDATAAADTKALIKAAYDADPANVKQVYILGHVPVPYAGNSAWDGHGNHSGAWSADGYYGDMDGTWTDSSVNNSTTTSVRLTNVPGDGRLDQSSIPSTLELMVGRVDLVNMTRAPASAASETALLRRYLRKAHDFKHKQGAYANVERRVLIRDGFGTFGSEGFMRTGWAWGFTGVGRPPEVTFDEAPSGNWWTHAATNTYLMANGNGGGSYETCGSVGATADFGRRPFRAAFVSLFGSYFGDWDVTNNFMRAPLAGNATGDSLGLCCFWAGRPSFFMHHMATGETLGYSMRASMNSQFNTFSNPVYSPVNFGGGGTHCGLLGDPSLRMHVVEPPRNLVATSASGSVNLAWTASTETPLLGYHVYRAATPAGPFTRLTPTPLPTPSYADTTATAGLPYTYLVRTLKLETAPGGTYQNLSVGAMATLTANAAPTGAPLNPSSLTVTTGGASNAQLSWVDNATDETGYRVERKVNGIGSYTPVASLGAGAVAHTDGGPFVNGSVYYYRVIATGPGGDSLASNEVSFDAVPGFFEFNETITKVSRTVGTALIPVKRFGGVNGPVSVNYSTADSSAIAGSHYTATSGTLNWADGDASPKNVPVTILNDASPKQARQFRINLNTPSAGTGVGTYGSVAVLIEDPNATLPVPWNQTLLGTFTSSSAAVQAEGGISSTTVGGSGLSTAAGSEVGQFIYQTRTGDGVMTAFVGAGSPAQGASRSAMMIRENATSGSALMAATVASTDAGTGSRLMYRAASGNSVLGSNTTSAVSPQWLRLTRAGNTFTSECSPNGASWTLLGTVTIPMAVTAQWGFFHHSDDLSGTTYSGNFQTVGFQNISFGTVSVPGTPGNFVATQPTPTRVTLTWDAAPLASGYRLERRTENGTFAQIIDFSGATLTFNDDSVASNTGYEYRVYAYNSGGNGPSSSVARITTPPGDVFAYLTTDSATNADATVKASAPATNFGNEATLSLSGNTSAGSLTAASKTYFRFDLTGIPTVKTASLRLAVQALNDLSMVGFNFFATLRFLPDGNDGWDEATINWNTAPLNNTAGTTLLGGSTVSTLSFSSANLPSAGGVIALDASVFQINNNRGADNLVTYAMYTSTPTASIVFGSKEHPTLPPPTLEVTYASTLPSRPSFFTATAGTGAEIVLQWVDNSSTETGFQIERRTVGGSFAPLTTTLPDAVAFTDTTTTLNTTYEYRIRANSPTGASAWSLIVTATSGGGTGTSMGLTTYQSALEGSNLSPSLSPTADFDRDGLANLLEYALGTKINAADKTGKPTLGTQRIGSDDFLTLTFARRIDATDVALTVEVSDSADGPWTALDPLLRENQASASPDVPAIGWQTLVIKDTVPIADRPGRFMRLRATAK